MGSKSQCMAWLGIISAATPSGPNAEVQEVLAASVEDEAWSVLAVGEEKVSKASVEAWERLALYWVPAAFGGTVPSASKETKAAMAGGGRAHVPVDLSSWEAQPKRPRLTVLSVGRFGRA